MLGSGSYPFENGRHLKLEGLQYVTDLRRWVIYFCCSGLFIITTKLLPYWWCLVLKSSFHYSFEICLEKTCKFCGLVVVTLLFSFFPSSLPTPSRLLANLVSVMSAATSALCSADSAEVFEKFFEKFCFRNFLYYSQSWKCSYCGAGVVYMSFYFYLHWNEARSRHESTKMSWKWKCLSVTGLMCLSDWELEAPILLWWAF